MIVLIASYPKSGNTWMRRFLCCYLAGHHVPLSEMGNMIPLDSDVPFWTNLMGEKPPTEDHDKCYPLRQPFFSRIEEKSKGKKFYMKTHIANLKVNGHDMFPQSSDMKVIHIVRNPLDVLVSFSYHMSCSIEDGWGAMKEPKKVLISETLKQLPQPISSYSVHLMSWRALSNSDSYLFVRYEDMLAKPITTFAKVIQHIGLAFDERRFVDALSWSNFEVMKKEEEKDGFSEAVNNKSFFRKGQFNGDKQDVPASIRDEMAKNLAGVCRLAGYKLT